MFTFRAELHAPTDGPALDYEVFEAPYYRVKSIRGTDGYEVSLAPISMAPRQALYVGSSHPFLAVYVMNQHGKTVDTIR